MAQAVTWQGSALVNDLEGDLYRQSAGWPSTLGPVYVLSAQAPVHRFDPTQARGPHQWRRCGVKRTWTQLWLVLWSLTITGTIWSLSLTSPSRATHAAPSNRCGTERWDVKTLADPAAARVALTPITATVEGLRAIGVPGPLALHTPRFPQEMKTYKVTAKLVEATVEKDHDYHLVLVGSTSQATMIAEIPDPACVSSPMGAVISAIAKARAYFDQTFGIPGAAPHFTKIPGTPTVTVTGVLFFDVLHGQHGVAPNGVELHPVLDLRRQ